MEASSVPTVPTPSSGPAQMAGLIVCLLKVWEFGNRVQWEEPRVGRGQGEEAQAVGGRTGFGRRGWGQGWSLVSSFQKELHPEPREGLKLGGPFLPGSEPLNQDWSVHPNESTLLTQNHLLRVRLPCWRWRLSGTHELL